MHQNSRSRKKGGGEKGPLTVDMHRQMCSWFRRRRVCQNQTHRCWVSTGSIIQDPEQDQETASACDGGFEGGAPLPRLHREDSQACLQIQRSEYMSVDKQKDLVGAQSSQMKMTPVPLHGGFSWAKHIMKRHPHMLDISFTMSGLLEQINTTRDVTDYSARPSSFNICCNHFAFLLSYNVGFLCDPAGTAYGNSDLISNANIF
ncbi:hypothetical protein QYF36_017223 [Acer negundo]|nr:hypothetical protein QYF36_017223 [Acer negundo]